MASLIAIAGSSSARRRTRHPDLSVERRGYGSSNGHTSSRGKSDVNLAQLTGCPPYGVLRRHALHRLGVHVDDDVLAQHLAGFAIRRPGIAGELSGAAGIAERQHDRILLPERV